MSITKDKGVKYLIGQGSFGKVYRYSHNNQQYAIKKIYKDKKNHPQLIQQIQAQGRIMRNICNHRNVVGFIGQMSKQKYVYLLTQLVPNGDLKKINFLPSEDDLWEIVMQLAMGLHHLRKNNVIHRDIKPENILVKQVISPCGSQTQVILKFADFGLAQNIRQGDFLQGIAGSPIYLAPQMCNHDLYSYEIDVWSMGITLYQLANQQKSPYHQEIYNYVKDNSPSYNEKQLFKYLMALIQTKTIKCNSPYIEINKLIESMLQKNPKKRITPLQILNHKKVVQKLARFNKKQCNNLFIPKGFNMSTKQQFLKQQSLQKNFFKKPNHKNQQKQQKAELAYSPSIDSLQIFLSSRMSKSIISQLNSSQSKQVKSFKKFMKLQPFQVQAQ